MAGRGGSVPTNFRRAEARGARGRLGKMARGPARTCRGAWVGLRCTVAGCPREQAAGDELCRGGGAPARYDGGGRAWELH